jgi:hypothetical protein
LRTFGCSFNTHIICRQVIWLHHGEVTFSLSHYLS